MEQIIKKIGVLENIWKNIFLDHDYLLFNINYKKNEQANYPGVIFGYLQDTIPIVENYLNSRIDNKHDCFLHTIGFLQTIYIQQDLIDELLQLFKIQKSSSSDKEPNRSLRNELAGHPIRRVKNEDGYKTPNSYSLFSYETTKVRIDYLKYSKDQGFKFQMMQYETKEIIKRHEIFLLKYLDQIFEKVYKILQKFYKSNNCFFSDKIQFEKKIELIQEKFNGFFKKDEAFNEIFILQCWKKREEHPRYKYAIDLFERELKNHVLQISNDIINLKSNWTITDEQENDELILDNSLSSLYYKHSTSETPPKNDHYTLGKLYENHPIFGINFFKEKYSNNLKITNELNYMESTLGTPEFYCSYNYFRYCLLEDEY